MAGLNNIISNTAQQTTTMPAWFDTAQQNVVSQATGALNAAPTPQNTVAQGAVNQLSGPTNAFTNATGTLQGIASGAANPWITDASTGQVTPNTNTAMGGLFQAQNQQLQQLMPNVTAPVTGANVASGNFGSLRGDTAYNKAIGDAIAQQNAAQYQAALSNQQTGVQAGIGAGNVAQQGINNALTVGQYQQASPFTNVSNYGKVLGGIQAPTTVQNQTQLSPLNQVAGLVSALGGQNPTGILGSLFGEGTAAVGSPYLADGKTPNPNYKPAQKGGLFSSSGILSGVGNAASKGWDAITGGGGSATPGTYPLADGGSMIVNADGSKTITSADGTPQYFDAKGNPVSSDQGLKDSNVIPGSSGPFTPGDTSEIDNTDYSQYTNPPTTPDYNFNYDYNYGDYSAPNYEE
jgi:hypothetical protein